MAVKTNLQSYDKAKATGNLKERCNFVGFAGDKKQRFSITPCTTCLERATDKLQDWVRKSIRTLKEEPMSKVPAIDLLPIVYTRQQVIVPLMGC